MQVTSTSIGRLATMVVFALSCFGLLMFLWLSFGGPVPLQPKGYRVEIAFPEGQALATQSDVRIAGVSVGKVVKLAKQPTGDRGVATIELTSDSVPLRADAKAILRTKTLLGETFVELTPGSATARAVPDGGRLADARVERTVEIDEILNTFDPRTREAFKTFQQETAVATEGRGEDLNNALGTLPTFVERGGDLLETLDTNKAALGRLVLNGGTVFEALTEDTNRLQQLVRSTEAVFETTAGRERALRETIAALPTFLRESRSTFVRTETFARRTRAVVRLLRQPTRDLAPTVRDLGALAPDLRGALSAVRALEPATRKGLPATSEVLRETRPVLEQLTLFLAQANPTLQFLQQNQSNTGDWFSQGGSAFADTLPTDQPGSAGHYLRQVGVTGVESVGIFRERLPTNRGNSYNFGEVLADRKLVDFTVPPSWDCRNTGGERKRDEATGMPGCWVAPKVGLGDTLTKYPLLQPADYSKTGAARGR